MSDNKMKFIIRVVLPLLLIIYIGIETILKLQHSSLCSSTGCKMAGELLRFNSIYLNIFGIIGALGILIAGWKSLKDEIWEKLFFVILYSAIAFESIMIAFQIFVNPEPCKFCMGVYGSLVLIGILANTRQFIYFLPIVLAIFSALSMLNIPKNEHLVKGDGIYLIHSSKCPHCKKVKKYFKEHNISYKGIPTPSTTARFFANTLDIHQIPIALIKHGRKIEVIYGDEPIIRYFQKDSNTISDEKESKNINLFKSEDEGCGFDLVGGASDCSK
jgi:uncharacterized membrane protein